MVIGTEAASSSQLAEILVVGEGGQREGELGQGVCLNSASERRDPYY